LLQLFTNLETNHTILLLALINDVYQKKKKYSLKQWFIKLSAKHNYHLRLLNFRRINYTAIFKEY